MSDHFPFAAQPIIEVQRLTRQFDSKIALNDLSLIVPRGGVFGLIGGNGAGKTTVIRHILGMLKAQSGSVGVFGLDPVENPVGVLGRIGYLSEDRVAIIHEGRIMLTASMDEIKESHRRMTLRFGKAMSQPPALVGTLACEGGGAEWTYVCNGESEQLRRAAEAIGATVVDDSALSLDEIFVLRIQ